MKRILFPALLLHVFFSYGQEYKEMIARGTYSLKEIQESANAYFSEKGIGKGSGYKQFKRWEYNAQRMMDSEGYVVNDATYMKELKAYNKSFNQITKSTKTDANWEQVGPTAVEVGSGYNHGLGRITSIAIDASNANHMIIGAQTGGVWKTTDKGKNWTPLCDNYVSMSVYSLSMHPSNSKIYYWGSKEGNIYKSTNAGSTWELLGVAGSGPVNKIRINPDNDKIMYATNEYSGIYKSTNGGTNWAKVVEDFLGMDITYKPGDLDTIYAAGSQFHVSYDGGENWITRTGVFGNGYKLIGVSPADPETVYVVEEKGGIFGAFYVSKDGGVTFTKKNHSKNYFGYESDGSDDKGQAPRDMAIAVSPTNINEVHIGGIITHRSLDGGEKFTATSRWTSNSDIGYCHADIDDLLYNGGELYVVSDGGVFVASAPAGEINKSFFKDLTEGMGIHQFYKIGISQTTPCVITGGAQDNGTNAYVNNKWVHWFGADGMESFVDKSNPNILYGTYQNGGLVKSMDSGRNLVDISSPAGSGNWVTPFEQDPSLANTIYAGYTKVYKSTNGGTSWTEISQDFGNNLDIVKVAPSNNQVMYAYVNDMLYKTNTGGSENWTELPAFTNGRINYLAIHPVNPNTIAVASYNGSKVYISKDGGQTWEAKGNGLPNFSALCLEWHKNDNNGLYVGMNYGVYYINDKMNTWVNFSNLLPNTYVNELEINYVEKKIYAGTYGRGLWKSNLYESSSTSSSTGEDLLNDMVKVFPNPVNDLLNIQLTSEIRGEIRVFNAEGKLVNYQKLSGINNTVSMSELPSGIYYLRLNLEGGIITKKIVKR